MRKILPIILIITLFGFTASSNDITGKWYGLLNNLRIVFNISKADNGKYNSTIASPDQNAEVSPITNTTFKNNKLDLEIPKASISYTGKFNGNSINGTFTQGGVSFKMNLSRTPINKTQNKFEPRKPFLYYSKDVTFKNKKDNITLVGTLSLPKEKGIFPAVILITGAGPQNRNEEVNGFKPFLYISDYLTRHGIAVLRFDDRGVGKSEGNFKDSTIADFTTDVESAISYLKTVKEVNNGEIGLIGHSEGGMVAYMVASKNKDISFVVLLATPGIQCVKFILLQSEKLERISGVPENKIEKNKNEREKILDIILNSENLQILKSSLTEYIKKIINQSEEKIPKGLTEEEYVDSIVNAYTSPDLVYKLKHDPIADLARVKCPVLALNGNKDLMVPYKENLAGISNTLKSGKNVKIKTIEYTDLNHYFQECKKPSLQYSNIKPFSPVVLKDMTDWIKEQINDK